MPATFRPARAKGSTATPPAAPSPITATSTGLRLMAIFCPSPGREVDGFDGHVHLLFFRGGSQPRAGITDQVPACEILITAVERIAESPLQRQTPDAGEEGPRVRRETGGGAVVHRSQHGIFGLIGEFGKRLAL